MTKKTKKIFQYGIRNGQEGGGTKTEPKWVKQMAKKNQLRMNRIYKKYIMIRDILHPLVVLKNYITI